MAYQIVKSKTFLKNVLSIQDYLEKEWGLKAAINFQRILDEKIAGLSLQPKTGIITSKSKNIRKLTITKHNKIYYRIKGKMITILVLFESKQNPQRNKYE